jgi:hypothetical protein
MRDIDDPIANPVSACFFAAFGKSAGCWCGHD